MAGGPSAAAPQLDSGGRAHDLGQRLLHLAGSEQGASAGSEGTALRSAACRGSGTGAVCGLSDVQRQILSAHLKARNQNTVGVMPTVGLGLGRTSGRRMCLHDGRHTVGLDSDPAWPLTGYLATYLRFSELPLPHPKMEVVITPSKLALRLVQDYM